MFQFLRPLLQIFILHMGFMPDGRLCIRIMQGRTHIFIVITSTMTPTSGICLTDQESFAKCMVLWISAHFQTKQSPLTTQYHREQMFWHLFLSHYICWLGPHNNIIIMIIRIWYLVRENDDDDEEDDCGSACLVFANRTCPRTGLHFTFSSRLHACWPISRSESTGMLDTYFGLRVSWPGKLAA